MNSLGVSTPRRLLSCQYTTCRVGVLVIRLMWGAVPRCMGESGRALGAVPGFLVKYLRIYTMYSPAAAVLVRQDSG